MRLLLIVLPAALLLPSCTSTPDEALSPTYSQALAPTVVTLEDGSSFVFTPGELPLIEPSQNCRLFVARLVPVPPNVDPGIYAGPLSADSERQLRCEPDYRMAPTIGPLAL